MGQMQQSSEKEINLFDIYFNRLRGMINFYIPEKQHWTLFHDIDINKLPDRKYILSAFYMDTKSEKYTSIGIIANKIDNKFYYTTNYLKSHMDQMYIPYERIHAIALEPINPSLIELSEKIVNYIMDNIWVTNNKYDTEGKSIYKDHLLESTLITLINYGLNQNDSKLKE